MLTFEIWVQEDNKVVRKRKYSGFGAKELAVEPGFNLARKHGVSYLRRIISEGMTDWPAKVQKIEYIGSGQCQVTIARGEH